jgi:hypothetical protein
MAALIAMLAIAELLQGEAAAEIGGRSGDDADIVARFYVAGRTPR